MNWFTKMSTTQFYNSNVNLWVKNMSNMIKTKTPK